MATQTSVVAGDTIWVADDHAETGTGGITFTFPGTIAAPNIIICADRTQASPGTGDYRTTATVTQTSANSMIVNGSFYMRGLTFTNASGAAGLGNLTLNNVAGWQAYDNCNIRNGQASSSSGIVTLGSFSNGGNANKFEFINTSVQGTLVGFGLNLNGDFSWRGGGVTGSVFPTTLFQGTSVSGLTAILEGVDLSSLGSGKTLVGVIAHASKFHLRDCKLNASVTVTATPAAPGNALVYVNNCDSGATNYRNEAYLYEGTVRTETTVIRTGGASDGTTGFSWVYVTTANSMWVRPLESGPYFKWNSTTGSAVTLTAAGIWNAAALPNNDDIWLEATFQGSASFPTASIANGTKANFSATGSALTADSTSAWDSIATARANTTAYTLGQVIKLASNPGRIFFCTTAGTSSGSEPGGYASVVDGGSVTDNAAVFRAGVRFTLSVTCTSPAMVGPIYVNVKVAKVSSTFYVDPALT